MVRPPFCKAVLQELVVEVRIESRRVIHPTSGSHFAGFVNCPKWWAGGSVTRTRSNSPGGTSESFDGGGSPE
jgi:hypothetical protein